MSTSVSSSINLGNIILPPIIFNALPTQLNIPQPQIQQPIDITLMEHQIEPYAKIDNAIKGMASILLCSPTGSGKTIIALKLGKQYNLTLFYIGPASIEKKVLREGKKYGVEIIFISYTRLAGKSGKIGHPYLRVVNGDFYVTQEYKDLVKKRILLIFDECQTAKKTTSLCSQACFSLSKEVRQMNCGSRIMLMSASPFDKVEFSEASFKLMGIIQQKQLLEYRVADNEYILEGYGFEEAVAYCNKINVQKMKELYPEYISAKNIRNALYDMFIQIVKTRAVFTMEKAKITAKFIPESHYYNVPAEELPEIEMAIAQLNKAARPNGEDGGIAITGSNMGRITLALVRLEKSKIKIFERAAKHILQNTVNDKVIIYLWYDETVNYLLNALAQWNPLRCDGKVTPKKRDTHTQLFQEPNNQYRVIIAKPTAFGIGIDLDDCDGNFPRHTFINPNFHFDKIHQAAGRTYRSTTKSNAYCTLCYVKDTEEDNIISALRKKTDVTKDIVFFDDDVTEDDEDAEEEENPTIFPADYPIVEDEDINNR